MAIKKRRGFARNYNGGSISISKTDDSSDNSISTNAIMNNYSVNGMNFISNFAVTPGLDINIEVVPPAVAIELRSQSRAQFFRASWIADYPDEENYLSLFYSGNFAPNGPNYTHFSNENFDLLYEKAFLENDRDRRSLLYGKMDSIMMEEAPVVILYYDEVVRFVQKNILGMTANPINMLNLKTVEKN